MNASTLIREYLLLGLRFDRVEDGYVDPWKARAVRKQVEALCDEVKGAALDLVDAFAIPDACLAPIAFAEGTA